MVIFCDVGCLADTIARSQRHNSEVHSLTKTGLKSELWGVRMLPYDYDRCHMDFSYKIGSSRSVLD